MAKLWIPGSYAYKIAFTQDDRRVAVVGVNGEKRVLTWKPESLIAEACARLTRNLTEAEWAIYLPMNHIRKHVLNCHKSKSRSDETIVFEHRGDRAARDGLPRLPGVHRRNACRQAFSAEVGGMVLLITSCWGRPSSRSC